jgi:hypothetical protein
MQLKKKKKKQERPVQTDMGWFIDPTDKCKKRNTKDDVYCIIILWEWTGNIGSSVQLRGWEERQLSCNATKEGVGLSSLTTVGKGSVNSPLSILPHDGIVGWSGRLHGCQRHWTAQKALAVLQTWGQHSGLRVDEVRVEHDLMA